MSTSWEILEGYLGTVGVGVEVNCAAIAADLGVSTQTASGFIQSYLTAQRGDRSRTSYVLSRRGRTRSAVWHIGSRAADVRQRTAQGIDDMTTMLVRAMQPDLMAMGLHNPRAIPVVEANVRAMVAGLAAMSAAMGGGGGGAAGNGGAPTP